MASTLDSEERDALVLDQGTSDLLVVLPVVPVAYDRLTQARDPRLRIEERHCGIDITAVDEHSPLGFVEEALPERNHVCINVRAIG